MQAWRNGDRHGFLDGQARPQVRRLKGSAKASRGSLVGGPVADVVAEHGHPAGVGRLVAGQELEDRGLARSVRSDQAQDLTIEELKVDAVNGGHAAEGLA